MNAVARYRKAREFTRDIWLEPEKAGRRGRLYATAVVGALRHGTRRAVAKLKWEYVEALLASAHQNGFESGVVWAKGEVEKRLLERKPCRIKRSSK